VGAQQPLIQEARVLTQQVLELYGQGRFSQAIPLAERALEIHERELGPQHADTATALNNLAQLYHEAGDYAKAERMYERALAIREQVLEPADPNIAVSLSNLASLYQTVGAYAKAEPLFTRALVTNPRRRDWRWSGPSVSKRRTPSVSFSPAPKRASRPTCGGQRLVRLRMSRSFSRPQIVKQWRSGSHAFCSTKAASWMRCQTAWHPSGGP
jgi:tetratricopeptide (TPR) repeat protein